MPAFPAGDSGFGGSIGDSVGIRVGAGNIPRLWLDVVVVMVERRTVITTGISFEDIFIPSSSCDFGEDLEASMMERTCLE